MGASESCVLLAQWTLFETIYKQGIFLRTMHPPSNQPTLVGLEIDLTIISGKKLVAKDRNFFGLGKNVSSDVSVIPHINNIVCIRKVNQ